MASLTTNAHSVNLERDEASAASLEALRGVMRSDAPYFDEPPVLEDVFYPSEADSLWWAIETEPDPYDQPVPILMPSGEWDIDRGGFFGWGPGVDPC